VEIGVALGELHRREVRRHHRNLGEFDTPLQDLANRRSRPGQLTSQELLRVVAAQLGQETVIKQPSTGIVAVADALGKRIEASLAQLRAHVDELIGRELLTIGNGDSDLVEDLGVVVDLLATPFEWGIPDADFVAYLARGTLLGAVLELRPVERIG